MVGVPQGKHASQTVLRRTSPKKHLFAFYPLTDKIRPNKIQECINSFPRILGRASNSIKISHTSARAFGRSFYFKAITSIFIQSLSGILFDGQIVLL